MRIAAVLMLLLPVLAMPQARAVAEGKKEKVAGKPRLVVLLVFDQLRGDYPERWRSLFGKGGFERLLTEGVWFPNCHYDYAHTITAAGHCSLVTGCPPARHGILGNDWYDRATGKSVSSVSNPRYPQTPPPPLPADPKKKPTVIGAWPGRRLQPTVGDELHKATAGRGKVVSLSIKDRSAILMAALRALACYWFDADAGNFVTSTYYRETPHSWVKGFNAGKHGAPRSADRWFGSTWNRLRSDIDYAKFSGPDDVAAETKGIAQGRTFPHPLDGGLKKIGPNYYDALTNSPWGNELLMELAWKAIEAEDLGGDEVPDLLCLSFSSNDLVGHAWGPDSQEVLDMTLRTDRLLANFLAKLDARLGKGNYAVVLSADHGICPLPEVAQSRGEGGGRIDPGKLKAEAQAFLSRTFTKEGDKLPWIEASVASMIYLNRSLIDSRKLPQAEVENALARWLAKQPGIQAAFTRSQLSGAPSATDDPLLGMVRKSYHAPRAGEVFLVTRPHWLLSSRSSGTTHGAPHPYDTHVPLLVFGGGVRPAVRNERVSPLATAAILAHLLGIEPPAGAEHPLPECFK